MASLNNLTDNEIRLKLTELGFPVGPITSTTRSVLLKKLKHLLEQAKSGGDGKSRSRVSLSSYSSGEDESEDDTNVNSRRSMPPPKSTIKSTRRKSTGRSPTVSQDSSPNLSITEPLLNNNVLPSANSTFKASSIETHYSTNHSPEFRSFSHSPEIASLRQRIRNSASPTNNFRTNSSHSPSVDPFDTGSDSDINEVGKSISVSSHFSQRRTKDSDVPYLPSTLGSSTIRSRFQPSPRTSSTSLNSDSVLSYTSPKSGTGTSDVNSLFRSSQPYSSEFTRRLSASSRLGFNPSFNPGLSSKLRDVKESDDEDISSSPVYSARSSSQRRDAVSALEGRIWKNGSTVSMVLVMVLVLFFGGIAVLYLNMRTKEAPITAADTNFPVCKAAGEKPGGDCVLDTEMQPAMNMFRILYQELHDRAVSVACRGSSSSSENSALSDAQLIQLVVEKQEGFSLWEAEKHMGNVKVLVKSNPQWGVVVTENGLDIPYPNLPFFCYIFSFVYTMTNYALRGLIGFVTLFGVVKGFQWWRSVQERNRKEVFRLVESIIELLSNHQQSAGEDNYLAISHVRDQLIPPYQRQRMAGAWAAAVKYLEENESRVRAEVQEVAGEECHVWRWLPSPRSNGRRKVWQGQAFETIEGSVNSLSCSPTPCLKIRHMFDPDTEVGDEWVTRVQDAILEKCEGIKVLHIAVDKNSREGCVYLKCSSPEEAGRAYRALHGSWFDSKLVTVKYLRLERYYERFPEAARTIGPLLPSNDRKLSLQ